MWLLGTNYKPWVLQDALQAKAAKGGKPPTHPPPVATITEAMEEISELLSASSLVAALFPKSGPSSLDNEQSFDSSTSLVSPPLKCDHFMWKCLLDGPTDPLPVNALIDSGAHMVLIRSALVCKLGLP